MPKPISYFVKCVDCNRGYYREKSCSAGWKVKKRSRRAPVSGCFIGERIKAEAVQ